MPSSKTLSSSMSKKTHHAFETTSVDECIRFDFCLVFSYDRNQNTLSWRKQRDAKIFPKQEERRDREIRKKAAKLARFEHSNREIVPSKILSQTIKKIKRAGL